MQQLSPTARRPTQRQHGVTLLEVLISLLVTSIGLLGLAGLQIHSLKNSQGAALRAQANVLAYDMFDRMRASAAAADAGAYDIALDNDAPADSSTLSALDLQQWRGMLAATLPEGSGAVSCSAAPICIVTVEWVDPAVTLDVDADGDVDGMDRRQAITLVSAL